MNHRRRRVLQALGVTLAGLAGCQGRTDDDDNQTPVGSPESDPTDTPPSDGTAEPSKQAAWHVETDAAIDEVQVINGNVYAGTGGRDAEAGTAELLSVTSDGTVRWRESIDRRMARVATVDDGTVYAITGNYQGPHGSGYQLHALDAADGSTDWVWAPELTYKFFEFVGLDAESVFVGTRDDAIAADGEELYAINRADGSVRWSAEVGDVAGGVVVDGIVVAGRHEVRAFDAASGDSRWSYRHDDIGALNTAGFGGHVLLGDQTLRGLDTGDGSVRWTYGEDALVTSWDPVGDGVVVGTEGSVAELDDAGSERWRADRGVIVSQAITGSDTLFLTDDTTVVGFDRSDGTERWTAETADPTEYPRPAGLANGHLVYDGQAGVVGAIDTATGEPAWTWSTPSGGATAQVLDGTVVVASDAGLRGLGVE
ncbi:PQQ-binding-like beta-propeller repeat protein [Halobacteriales archaeon Cl-PHB]